MQARAFTILLAGLISRQQRESVTKDGSQRHPAGQGNKPSPTSRPIPNIDLSMIRWTRVVGVFTGVLAFVGVLQFWSFIESERSFLTIKFNPAVFTARIPIKVTAEINNSGHVAANINSIVVIRSPNLSKEPNYLINPTEQSAPPVVPQQTTNISFRFSSDGGARVTLDDAEATAINGGTVNLYVYGYIVYKDYFSVLLGSSTIGFCVSYHPPSESGHSTWETCQEPAYTYAR